jgi:excisionase family DNA binding protein
MAPGTVNINDYASAIEAAGVEMLETGDDRRPQRPSSSSGVQPDQRLLLTVSEAAHRLGIGRSLLYELLTEGKIESIHVGRLRRIPPDALAACIDGQRPNG